MYELQSVCSDLLPATILSTTWPEVPAPPGMVLAPFATTAYVRQGTTLVYVRQEPHAVTLTGADGNYWLAVSETTVTDYAQWTTEYGSHYRWRPSATQPADLDGLLVAVQLVVSGGAITTVTPIASRSTLAAAWRGLLALGTMATQNANAVAITGGTIRLPVLSTVGGIWIEDSAGSGLYGIRSQVSSGTDKYNIFADGTAPNYFASKVGVNTSNIPAWLSVEIDVASGAALGTRSTQAGTVTVLLCHNTTNTIVGSITSSETATAFNTTSDARLKTDVLSLTGALDVLRQIPARTWRWRADGTEGVGFVASEVQGVVEGVITGAPDAVDEQGQIVPQQIDYSKLVPWLWSVCQELLQRLERVETQLAGLTDS
jgi:hypothetical protein